MRATVLAGVALAASTAAWATPAKEEDRSRSRPAAARTPLLADALLGDIWTGADRVAHVRVLELGDVRDDGDVVLRVEILDTASRPTHFGPSGVADVLVPLASRLECRPEAPPAPTYRVGERLLVGLRDASQPDVPLRTVGAVVPLDGSQGPPEALLAVARATSGTGRAGLVDLLDAGCLLAPRAARRLAERPVGAELADRLLARLLEGEIDPSAESTVAALVARDLRGALPGLVDFVARATNPERVARALVPHVEGRGEELVDPLIHAFVRAPDRATAGLLRLAAAAPHEDLRFDLEDALEHPAPGVRVEARRALDALDAAPKSRNAPEPGR